MNLQYYFLFLILLLVARPAFSQTSLERDRIQLREQRDKALATAAEPINRKYQASLEQLLKRATQLNDLDTAVKLKDELTVIQAQNAAPANASSAAPSVGSETRIIQALTTKDWFFHWETSAPNTPVRFHPNRKYGTGSDPSPKEKWSLELKWVVAIPEHYLIPIDDNTLRGFFISTGRQVGAFAEKK